jgi:hypothetical protein
VIYKKTEKLTEEVFKNPGSEYRATPFWAWNCRMTEDKVDLILESLKSMGMGGAHVHCRTGMANPYMGEEFLDLVKYSNKKSKEMGLLTWLYDEDRWPSGAGGGLVTKDHKYRMRFLLFTPERQEGKKIPEGELRSSGQAVRSDERTFLAAYRVKLVDDYLADYSIMKEGEPVGEGYEAWYAYLEVSGDNPWFNNEAYLNTLDKHAVKRFVEVTHEKYYEELGDEFGSSIPAIFTDEPQFSHKTTLGFAGEREDVLIPYTDDLEETFRAAYGHGLLPSLPELFWELGEDKVSRIRYEYHDHIAERFADAFADTIGDWCKAHKIALTGHMMEEPTLGSQTAALGEAMRSYRSFEIPGIDMLCDRRELSTAKQAESAVHQYGKEAMLSELYGVTNWDFDFRGHKLQGDWQAALGVTVRVPHLTWTSMAGEAKRDYPASIGYQSPWYQEYPLIENHFARVNAAMTRGVPHVRLGVIHPIESYWLYWGPKDQTSAIREEMDENFDKLIKWLLYGTMDFDFIAESLLPELNKGQENENRLKAGAMNYDAILVPNCLTLRSSTLEILEAFKARGGRIIFTGELPVMEDAYPSDRGKKLAESCEIVPFSKIRILQSLKTLRDVEIIEDDGTSADNLIYQMREEKDGRWLFLAHVNRTDLSPGMELEIGEKVARRRNQDLPREKNLKIIITGEWGVTLYDTLTGEISPLDGSECQIEMGNTYIYRKMYDQDSLLLWLEPKGEVLPASAVKTQGESRSIEIPSEAAISLSEPNVCILDMAEYRFDDGNWKQKEEILRIDNLFREELGYPLRMEAFAQPWTNQKEEGFDHTLSLKFNLNTETELENLLLALENDEATGIFLDGKKVENRQAGWYTDHCIRTVELPPVSAGRHELMLEIPYNSKVDIEAMFLLGDFGVKVEGRKNTLTEPVKTLAFADITGQGYPFYGGNLTYKIPFDTEGGAVKIRTNLFRAPVLGVKVDGKKCGNIAFSPYEICVEDLKAGAHELELTVFGNRVNTFGTLHNCDEKETWYGPNAWRTAGDSWSYEYQLKPTGLLKAPVLTEIKESK